MWKPELDGFVELESVRVVKRTEKAILLEDVSDVVLHASQAWAPLSVFTENNNKMFIKKWFLSKLIWKQLKRRKKKQ